MSSRILQGFLGSRRTLAVTPNSKLEVRTCLLLTLPLFLCLFFHHISSDSLSFLSRLHPVGLLLVGGWVNSSLPYSCLPQSLQRQHRRAFRRRRRHRSRTCNFFLFTDDVGGGEGMGGGLFHFLFALAFPLSRFANTGTKRFSFCFLERLHLCRLSS